MDEGGLEPPRQYYVHPQRLMLLWGLSLLGGALVVGAVLTFTPLRGVFGTSAAEMRQDVRLNALRVAALQDSVQTQQRYIARLRGLMTGEVDTSQAPSTTPPEQNYGAAGSLEHVARKPRSQNWDDHEQPALPAVRMTATQDAPLQVASSRSNYLSSLQLPGLPPVEGFLTRGYNARTGHYAVDIAVEKGTVVRSIGDGHVILADWTHEGGYALAVQHADGYVSVYKHNQRLLKHVGDRVRDREAVAISGNSGEVTTGPHLHFELWQNGLAQDPKNYFVGW